MCPGDFGKPRILQRGYGAHVDFGDPPDQKFDHCVLVLPGLVGDDPLLSSLGYVPLFCWLLSSDIELKSIFVHLDIQIWPSCW